MKASGRKHRYARATRSGRPRRDVRARGRRVGEGGTARGLSPTVVSRPHGTSMFALKMRSRQRVRCPDDSNMRRIIDFPAANQARFARGERGIRATGARTRPVTASELRSSSPTCACVSCNATHLPRPYGGDPCWAIDELCSRFVRERRSDSWGCPCARGARAEVGAVNAERASCAEWKTRPGPDATSGRTKSSLS
jgi:hypothetical protein